MYDLTTIKRISKNDNAIIIKYIHAFIDHSEGELAAIDENMAENRWNDIAEVLHKMKTSVAYFGMNDIEKIVINTEMNIKNGIDTSVIREQIKEIKKLLTNSFQLLREEIKNLPSS